MAGVWRPLWLLAYVILGSSFAVTNYDDSYEFDILNYFALDDSEPHVLGSRDHVGRDYSLQNVINHYFAANKLDCNFDYSTCGWSQESDISKSWYYSYADQAMLFSHQSGSHAPSLESPNIDQSLFGFCFTFDYQLENVDLDIKIHLKDTNSIHTLQSINTGRSGTRDGHQVIDIDVISDVSKLVLSPRILNVTDNFAKLSNFNGRLSGSCGYSQVYNSQMIKDDQGEVIVLKSNQIKECTWVSFNGTFNVIPDILIETKYANVRATIDYRSKTGFELCAYALTYMPFLSVQLSWRASENVMVVCSPAEYRCQSGECIKRETVCNAYRDCLSGDDETADVCAEAMSQLAFATFSTTVMLTYLVTYMKYIKDIRLMILGDRVNEENRLEEINLREIQRENH